jgi:putative ABC transport system ATP-binding protein
MDSVTRGNIILNNKDITLLSQDKLVKLRRKHLGFVFQQMNLMTNLSILENVTLPGYLIHKNKNIKEKGMEMLARVGISDLAYRMPHQVSGGQQQRAAIARALINEPDILFCDEPTGSLNSSSSEAVMDILLDCNENNHSILMVTHDVKTALRADRIIYIDDGSVKGEIYLEKYRKDKNLNDRNDMVQKWLEEMEW